MMTSCQAAVSRDNVNKALVRQVFSRPLSRPPRENDSLKFSRVMECINELRKSDHTLANALMNVQPKSRKSAMAD